ncbi:MAG: hypothetical protein NPIRA04_05280 [Nitrospirales bacterium]|nr:MAG: hypothetical protein NPIRA04_05280 [Nitrospirales bacterium]
MNANTQTAVQNPKAQTNKTKKPSPPVPPTLVGLDVGYGYVKIAWDDRIVAYPSVVSPIEPNSISLTLGDQSNVVDLEGQQYQVGEDAVTAAFRFQEQYDSWWVSPSYKALVTFAHRHIPAGSFLVTGLPLHMYTSTKAQAQIQTLVKQILRAKHVEVLSQGIGAYCYVLGQYPDLHGGRIALVDIGMRTTELIGMSGTQFLPRSSTGLVMGIGTLLQKAATTVSQKLGRTIDTYEIDWAIRQIKPLHVRGTTLNHEDVMEIIMSDRKDFAANVQREMTRLWNDRASNFDEIIFCGGGSVILQEDFQTLYPNALFLEDSALANVKGYLQYAQWQNNLLSTEQSTKNERL